ncbi:MAG: glycine--tRNA ligase subunit beta [Alphaproteobacteria bacterium]|nr:glycine--tRNA ligase subunit beta [Alphaproteobacteria bacterium]
MREELKGPRTSAPPAALDGFLKKTGLAKDQLTIQADPKGDFYIAVLEKPGRPAPGIIAEAAIEVIRAFPWPKSMHWEPSGLQWVRPLRSVLCLFDGAIVPFEIAGLTAANVTRGHRQMANEPFAVRDFEDYALKLRERRVVLDREERKAEIHRQALDAAARAGLQFRDDPELLDEVAGLVEWPVVLVGQFEREFLGVPNEVLITTMRKNQKYFALTESASFEAGPNGPAPQDGKAEGEAPNPTCHGEVRAERASNHAQRQSSAQRLSNRFLIVSNLEARDGGAAITSGNEKVIRPRLSDAKFFWDLDRKTTLESRLPELEKITFHARLGTQGDRVRRIERLAGEIAERIGADVAQAKLAARLCKADLVSGTVGEFPEVQGTIGGYLARAEGLGEAVATAIADHYRPQGPTDRVPTNAVSIAVALADKLDTLVGFFAIDEKPTGSKDPFALRRAALGVVRTLRENGVRLSLNSIVALALALHSAKSYEAERMQGSEQAADAKFEQLALKIASELSDFLVGRVRASLQAQGARFDVLDSAFDADATDDIVLFFMRVEALQSFLATEDGKTLLAGYKRAANILRIEEKKDRKTYAGAVDPAKLEAPEERALAAAIDSAAPQIEAAIAAEDFAAAMRALAGLRAPVDAFFEKVTVNAPDPALRANRLNLLARIKQAAHLVADFSRIEG